MFEKDSVLILNMCYLQVGHLYLIRPCVKPIMSVGSQYKAHRYPISLLQLPLTKACCSNSPKSSKLNSLKVDWIYFIGSFLFENDTT